MAITSKTILAGILGLALAAPAMAVDVDNVTFAEFGRTNSTPLFNYTLDGDTNRISLNGLVTFTDLQNGDFYTNVTGMLSAASTSPFVQNDPQFQQEGFNATFSFDGAGSSASLISTDPSSPIGFTSDIIDVSGFTSRDFAFNITGATPGFSVTEGGLGSPFVASVGGAFSGTGAVPEPASWAMLIVGFGLTGAMARRRNRGMVSVTA
jgi:hypothetical protein